jgi:hypothetical protein
MKIEGSIFVENGNLVNEREGYVLRVQAGLMIVKDSIFRNNKGTLFALEPEKGRLRFEGKNFVEGLVSDTGNVAMQMNGFMIHQILEDCTFYVSPPPTKDLTVIATTVSIAASLDPAESGTKIPVSLIIGIVVPVVVLGIAISIGVFLWKRRGKDLQRESDERREDMEPSFVQPSSEVFEKNSLSADSEAIWV